jgi:ABC-type transport system involved in multi-copper enzyme maturation permease subunit
MKIFGKLFVVLLVAAIAVIVLNALVALNPESLLTTPADVSDSAASVSPTLRAPVQEQDTNTLQDQNLTATLSIIGFIGLILIIINYMRWKR